MWVPFWGYLVDQHQVLTERQGRTGEPMFVAMVITCPFITAMLAGLVARMRDSCLSQSVFTRKLRNYVG